MSISFAATATEHCRVVEGFVRDEELGLNALVDLCVAALAAGNKLLFCGNGGSACDAMHIAGEFVGRFVKERRALPAIALSADTGLITAVANDYGYDEIFARQVEGLGRAGDVLIGLSTSGKSPNVVKALTIAREMGLKTVLFTGEKARNLPKIADITLIAPSLVTAHAQEAHMVALHTLAGLVETKLFSGN